MAGQLAGGADFGLLERAEPMHRLQTALVAMRQGRGRIVAIGAEAGGGKTTLVQRFVGQYALDARVYWSACENLSTPEVLLPLRDIGRACGESFDLGTDFIQSFEKLLRVLSNGGSPSILIIEDLHWADTATLDLIRYLARRILAVQALIVVTYRTEEAGVQSPLRQVLGEVPQGSVERIMLEPLSLAAVTSLAREAGRSGAAIFELTAGNPFLVSEALALGNDLPTDAVRDATLARASRLSTEARAVLEVVSVFPRRADTALIGELIKGAFDAGLDECVERGMLTLGEGFVRFRHELARRSVESALAPRRRRDLHQKAVKELRRRTTSRSSEVAHHAERAGDLAAMMQFSQRAGAEASRGGAPREAAAHFAAMLRHRESLAPEQLVDVLESYAEQAYLIGRADDAMASMIEAAQLRRSAVDARALGRDLTRLTRFAWMCGRRADAERYIGEAIAVLETVPAGVELAWAYSHQSQLDMLASLRESSVMWGERALELAERLGEKEVIVHALSNIGTAKAFNAETGCVELMRSLEMAAEGNFHDHFERASCNLTCSYYWRRDARQSLVHIERGVSYATARELLHWEGYLRGWRAMIRLDEGNWAAAEEEAQEICSRSYAADVYRFSALIALSRLRVRRGDVDASTPLDAARRLSVGFGELQRSVYIAVIDAERAWLASDIDVRGRLYETSLDVNANDQLDDVYRLAVERSERWVAEDSGLWLFILGRPVAGADFSPPYRDHCAGRWSEAAAGWRALHRPYEEAIALSGGDDSARRQALDIFDRLGAMPAAQRLRRQMRAAGTRVVPRGPIARTRVNPAGLTSRQVQVLNLVSEGFTNMEIARKLCISAKTAEHHVSAVMDRLGVATRRDAATAARDRGLLAG